MKENLGEGEEANEELHWQVGVLSSHVKQAPPSCCPETEQLVWWVRAKLCSLAVSSNLKIQVHKFHFLQETFLKVNKVGMVGGSSAPD